MKNMHQEEFGLAAAQFCENNAVLASALTDTPLRQTSTWTVSLLVVDINFASVALWSCGPG